jgi:hypothetical protein
MPDYFSMRHGLSEPAPGTMFREQVPMSFRMFLHDLGASGERSLIRYFEMDKLICELTNTWCDVERDPFRASGEFLKECEWFRIYDLIEAMFVFLKEKHSSSLHSRTRELIQVVNDALVKHHIGWRMASDGTIAIRGDVLFDRTVNTAIGDLLSDAKRTAASHLGEAIKALSSRPKANTCGAVSHATNAVECVLGEITGQAMTLGSYLDRHARLFHPALKKALDGIYGYASDAGARHGKERTEPTSDEAEFVVATCAAVCTMLTRKHRPDK